jgi:hypothetical protein
MSLKVYLLLATGNVLRGASPDSDSYASKAARDLLSISESCLCQFPNLESGFSALGSDSANVILLLEE